MSGGEAVATAPKARIGGIAVAGLTGLLLVVQIVLAARGIIDSPGGAAGFGVPATDASAAFYHAVYRDRNLVIALVGLVLLAGRRWWSLAVLCTVSISLPVYDIVALAGAGVPVGPVHWATAVALVGLSAGLWWQARQDRERS